MPLPFTKKPTKDEPATIRPLSEHQAYAAATARLAELEAEEKAILGRMASGGTRSKVTAAAVQAMVEGREVAEVPTPPAEDLNNRLTVVRRALAIVQEKREEAREEAAREAARAARPAHRKAIVRMAAAMLELALAKTEEQSVRDAIAAGGHDVRLAYGGTPILGNNPLKDQSSRLHYFLNEMEGQGLLPSDDPSLRAARAYLQR